MNCPKLFLSRLHLFFSRGVVGNDYFATATARISRKDNRFSTIYSDLNYVPRFKISSYISQLQGSVRRHKHFEVWLELTTCKREISFFDGSLVYIALPFLRQRTGSASPTSTFLFISLHAVLKLLASGPFAVTIATVQNISEQRADSLIAYARLLDESPSVRAKVLDGRGFERWREEKLYTYWEAALYRANLLSRWRIRIEA